MGQVHPLTPERLSQSKLKEAFDAQRNEGPQYQTPLVDSPTLILIDAVLAID